MFIFRKMGNEESTRTCPRCDVQLLESNMIVHLRDCCLVEITKSSDGSWKWKLLTANRTLEGSFQQLVAFLKSGANNSLTYGN
jgi:hypothetical protein